MGQVLVRRVTFLRQKGDVLGALPMEYVISRHALPLQDVILDGSRCLQRVGWLIALEKR